MKVLVKLVHVELHNRHRLANHITHINVHFTQLTERGYETHQLRIISSIHPLSIKQETTLLQALALTLAKGIHQLLQLSSTLNFEKDFVVLRISHFDVQMLRLSILGPVACRVVVVRHSV